MDKFIFRKQKALSSNLCDDLIDFYEKCPNKRRNPKESRNYTMLQLLLTNFPEVFNPLSECVKTYTKQHTFLQNLFHPWGWTNEFLLQKYEIGECYSGEHMEHGKYDYDCRKVLAWMVYLNDCSGGTCCNMFLRRNMLAPTKIHNKAKTGRFIYLASWLDAQPLWTTIQTRKIHSNWMV